MTFKTLYILPRYDSEGVPKEEVFYFELMPRLEEMYKDDEWKRAIRYPDERPRRFYSRSDVFDGTVYKALKRGAGRCVDFLVLGYCADAIQVDKRMSRNVLPGILRCVHTCVYIIYCLYFHFYKHSLLCSIMNYDPRVRQHALENMLLTFLLPPKMKTKCAHKFYALLEQELNELYYTGIAGGNLKGALIMVRADQKGKEFDLGLRSCTSYDAPCNVCELMAQPGYGHFTTTSIRDYRRFLPLNHPHRQDPSFGPPELRTAPATRAKLRSAEAVEIVQDPDITLTHYHGYRDLPLFYNLEYFKPFLQSAPDLSHNLSNFFKGVLRTVQPVDGMIPKWRLEASLSGRFPEIGSQVPQFVDADVANLFLDLDLESMRAIDLKECAKLMGVSQVGTKTILKNRIQQILQTFRG